MDRPTSGTALRTICIASAILIFCYSCLLAANSVAGFPLANTTSSHWPWLADKPLGEDGFYMLTVARNLATSHRLVYTYDMPATGIQPLATIAFAGIAAVVRQFDESPWVLIRLVLIFNSALFLLFAWLLARFTASLAPERRRNMAFSVAFLLTVYDYSIYRLFTYGLETGFYLCCLALCAMIWHRIVHCSHARWLDMVLFGVAAGFAGLSRIDFGLLFAILLVFLLIRRVASVWQVLVSGCVALIITSPWFLFVHSVSGSWLPSSGKAESRLITLQELGRVQPAFTSLLAHSVPWSFAGASIWPTTLLGIASLPLLFLLWKTARETRSTFGRATANRAVFLPWTIGLAVLALTYVVFFSSVHFYSRYLAPLVIVTVPLLSLALSELMTARKWTLSLLCGLVGSFVLWDAASLHLGHIGNPHVLSAKYIQQVFPETRVGAFQSGVIGYFNPNVENLDGKLNIGALNAAKDHRLEDFLDRERIDVLIDWPGYLAALSPDYLSRDWKSCPQPMPSDDGSLCYIRRSYASQVAAAPLRSRNGP